MASEVQPLLDELNATLKEQGFPFKLAMANLADLKPAPKNARFMRQETFANLVSNIANDRGLSQLPFCWHDGEAMHILSGHQRIKAAMTAGLTDSLLLYTDAPLSEEERVSRILSHNALVGQDDEATLRELWDQITDLGLKYYAGLTDDDFGELPQPDLSALAEGQLDYRTLWFCFLPEEAERIEMALEEARKLAEKDCPLLLARFADFDRTLRVLSETKAAHRVQNVAVALMIVLDIFDAHRTALSDGWLTDQDEIKHDDWVPLSSVIGTEKIPAAAAQTIKRAVELMRDKGDLTQKNLWQALEYLAADYLAGVPA